MFLSFRLLRILPALSTEVVLCAVVIGGMATALPLLSYYRAPGLYQYFLNITGNIEYVLPGVFKTNPMDTVNGSLWTIPPEIFCYVFLALMLLSRAYANRAIYPGRHGAAGGAGHHGRPFRVAHGRPVRQYHLFLCFVIGNLFYLWRDRIPSNAILFAVCAAGGLVLLRMPGFLTPSLFLLTYCIVYLGTRRIPLPSFFATGDYSYGIYLYAYPVQQLVAHWLPGLRIWWVNILISVPLVVLFAVFSWHVVEKPALSLKNRVRFLRRNEEAWLGRYKVRFGLALLLGAYAVTLMRWSGLDYSIGVSFRDVWPYVLALLAALSLLVAGPVRRRMSAPVATETSSARP